ncbi:MAG: triose-phosphate isomerase [Limnochordia bacterium]|nr:triose-phosphate isomerase [Bacillota bacterium]HOB09315.1 triose-phosphate isomerase [Limnochordia bacterium]NLH30590.1 triose-phosphate isomerase [Bacillota bacterium]HPT93393.1 triose-phosphate isomerase [Limnochordia bacterium]HPZ30129.1 triose-phosphate isomerase [Limnochordia bacterium]
MRKPIIAGNWKMHKTVSESVGLCEALDRAVQDVDIEVVVCPPFTALSAVCALAMRKVKIGAQNVSIAESGAFTGEISPLMLVDVCCSYVIIGHSERRQHFGETDAMVNKKVHLALQHGLRPIVCVGESLMQRRAGETEAVVVSQTKAALAGIAQEQVPDIVIAYEPIWAIGTGETASADDANEVIGTIRKTIAEIYGQETAGRIRIQYGGSVKPDNIRELMAQPEIDGALVGGASLDLKGFTAIVRYHEQQQS